MDIEKTITDKKETTEQKPAGTKKGQKKKGHVKKKEQVKSSPAEEVVGRTRARTQITNPFDGKKAPTSKKETKPIETIGTNRFKDLLAKFDKPKAEEKEVKEDPGPKKLDMSKFGFNSSSSGQNQSDMPVQPVVSNRISLKIVELMKSNVKRSNTGPIDPILEQRRKMHEKVEGDENDDDGEGEGSLDDEDDDLDISEEKDEENWDEHSNSGDEKEKKNEVGAMKEPETEKKKDKEDPLEIVDNPQLPAEQQKNENESEASHIEELTKKLEEEKIIEEMK